MRGARALLALTLGAPLLLLGGVHEFVVIVTGVLVVLLAVAHRATIARFAELSRPAQLAAAALWGCTAYVALQLVPLPPSILVHLSPHAAATWADADRMLGVAGTYRPVSLDPPGTVFSLATIAIVAAFFVVCASLCRSPQTSALVPRVLLGVLTTFVLVALLHAMFSLPVPYGLYRPLVDAPRPSPITGPLVNPNHVSAIAGALIPLALAACMKTKSPTSRWLACLACVAAAIVAVLSLSRGGVAVAVLELVVSLTIAWTLGRRRLRDEGPVIAVTIGVAASLIVGVVTSTPLLEKIRERNVSKLVIASRSIGLVRDFRWTGAGRGAFGSVFPAYEGPFTGTSRFLYPETWPAQLTTELGVPAAIAFAALLAAAFVLGLIRARKRLSHVCAAIALVGMVVHDLADFALEFVGAGFVAVALLAIVTSQSSSATSRDADRGIFALALAVVSSVFALGFYRGQSVEIETEELGRAWRANTLFRDSARLDAAIARHPAESFFPFLHGIRAMETSGAGGYFRRAITLAPYRAQPHFWFARWLLRAGLRGQAWGEYRAAEQLSPYYAAPVIADLVRAKAPLFELETLVTSEERGDAIVVALEVAQRRGDADALDIFIVERFPPAPNARLRRALRLRDAGDITGAVRAVENIMATTPRFAPAWTIAASLEPDDRRAEDVLIRGLVATDSELDLLIELTRRRGVRSGVEAVREDLERVAAALQAKNRGLYALFALRGAIASARGLHEAALSSYVEAAAAPGPERAGYFLAAAREAALLGRHTEAAELRAHSDAVNPPQP